MDPEQAADFSIALERYIDGSATEEDLDILKSGLASDVSLRELFILTLYRDEAIYRINEDRLQNDLAFANTVSDQIGSAQGQADVRSLLGTGPIRRHTAESSTDRSTEKGGYPGRSSLMLYVAGAAIAALVAVVFYPLISQFLSSGQQNPGGGLAASIPGVTVSPARLMHAHQMAWGSESKQANADQSLDAGDYEIESGYLQFEMSTGVTVIMHAPAEFSIDSPSEISLTSGALSAKVNEGAEGFVVNTPSGEVLDLGTEFGVAVRNNDAVEVHVMDGEVVASLPGKKQVQSLQIGQAGRMEADIGKINLVKPRTEKFVREWEHVGQSIQSNGAAWYLYAPPESVVRNHLEDENRFYVLPERMGFELFGDVKCEIVETGQHTVFQGVTHTIPAGTVVDSYLLHFDRADDIRGSVAMVEGSVYFDRPILGVIVSHPRLYETDRVLGHPDVQYPAKDALIRGLEHGRYNKDVVRISEDRKTLTVRLEAELNMDQLRVLVEPAP